MKYTLIYPAVLIIALCFQSCKEEDLSPPLVTLEGEGTVTSVLNEEYNDPGATAIDDIDGDISSSVYIESNVNVDHVGTYTVSYTAVDDAGNVSPPVSRTVIIYNTAEVYEDIYLATDINIYPDQDTIVYDVAITIDSTVNNRVRLSDFAMQSGREVFADIQDTAFIIPFQAMQDSLIDLSVQGMGWINDSLANVDYTHKENEVTRLLKMEMIRQENGIP